MPSINPSPASASPSPAAPRDWGLRSSIFCTNGAPASRLSHGIVSASTRSRARIQAHTASWETSRRKTTSTRWRCRFSASWAGSTSSSTTRRISVPAPLALLGDTECEDFERALATNVLGPFRLTKALLGALAASARQGRGSVVLNVSSDAAVNAYPTWGAYSASKAALRHLTHIWDAELSEHGVRFLSVDPGDMDTPLHELAVPDADRSTLKRPDVAARELLDAIAEILSTSSAQLKLSPTEVKLSPTEALDQSDEQRVAQQ